ncbi:MAG: LuxR C-terminal-related transcriptional regulator [Candidatus Promineifilaceae bacterium]|nr:LuxR C-terminal-related transcriptional regulator [Candidatus Promineifilaceae bacterium]
MTDILLQTKLYVPGLRPSLVPRPRLIEKLNRGLIGKMTLVSAPAGFGKTTLIASWGSGTVESISEGGIQHHWQLCWYSLDSDDNDPQQFFRYLAEAIRPLSDKPLTLPHLIKSEQPLPTTTLAKVFVADITAAGLHLALVLDDYHVIQSPEVNEAVSLLLDHMPPHMHLVIISRADPLLPLSRLRARGHLTEIRAADLRLTEDEAAAFINDLMQLNLTAGDIAVLKERTEGWVAGLQLAALSMENLTAESKHEFVTALSGDNRYILDYLLEEVLRHQPDDIQEFLLKTAILDRLCAPLCDFLMGFDGRQGGKPASAQSEPRASRSQIILERLERDNLFLIPLDNKREWYRYHHLFADLLSNQLQSTYPVRAPHLLQRASQWYEANNYLTDAFSHAYKSKDIEFCLRLVKRHARGLLVRAELVTLVAWLDKMPSAKLQNQPQLSIYYAWAATTLLQLDKAGSALGLVEQFLDAAPLADHELADWRGQIAILSGLIAGKRLEIARGVALTKQGLEQLMPENNLMRGLAISNLAMAHYFFGDTAAACETLKAAIPINQEAGNITETLLLFGILAQSTFEMGQLRRTESICRQGLQAAAAFASQADGRPLPVTSFIYVQLSQLYREWNRLEEAAAFAQQGIELASKESIGNLLMLRLVLALIHQRQRDSAATAAELAEVEKLIQNLPKTGIMEQIGDFLAYVYAQEGNGAAVQLWLDATNVRAGDLPSRLHETRYLIFARILIQQKRWLEAQQLLTALQQITRAGGRTGRLIHTLVLSAVVHQRLGNKDRAEANLMASLKLAEPEGYMTVFLDVSQPIPELLHGVKAADSRLKAYIQKLLSAFQAAGTVEKDKGISQLPDRLTMESALVEPLSERELEILALVAAGRSNRQIASELYLAIGTVKKHLSNIYGKLQVSSRTEAVARARKLALL